MNIEQLKQSLNTTTGLIADARMAEIEANRKFRSDAQAYVTALCAESTVQQAMDVLEVDPLFDTHHTRMEEGAIFVQLSTGGEVVLHGFKPDPPKPCTCNCHHS